MVKLDEGKVAALLGRSLSPIEKDNFKLYLDIAKTRLEGLLCRELDDIDPLPNDLALVWARFFGNITDEAKAQGGISSKRVEDFSITYREGYNPTKELMKLNAGIIAKYRACGGIRHGKVMPVNSGGLNLDDRV